MPIEYSIFDRTRRAFNRRIAPHRHSALLLAIVTAFVVRPLIGDLVAGSIIFSVAMLLLLLVALYNINVDEILDERDRLLTRSRRRLRLGWALATAAGLQRVLIVFVHSSMLSLAGSISWLLFLLFVTISELRSVLAQQKVTGETICAAVSTYLLLGFTWALLYGVMFQLHPNSFGGLAVAAAGHPVEVLHLFPVLGYFSLTTLSTLGFGDITPLSLQARYAAVAEGITGQFYLAILVARLVGLQMSQSAAQNVENQARALAD